MKVEIVYVSANRQFANTIELPEGSTVEAAIAQSGILRQFPEIDLSAQKVGIYGRLKTLAAEVAEGDRVEIYRPITADPETVARRDMPEEE